MEIYRIKFGQTLKALLDKKGFKQFHLAEKIGIEPPNVSRWINGINFPDEEHFSKICEVLEVDKEHFLGKSNSDLTLAIIERLPRLNEHQLRTVFNLTDGLLRGSTAETKDGASELTYKNK
jgi:transcriptional regulator with XRE-family HTH domain